MRASIDPTTSPLDAACLPRRPHAAVDSDARLATWMMWGCDRWWGLMAVELHQRVGRVWFVRAWSVGATLARVETNEIELCHPKSLHPLACKTQLPVAALLIMPQNHGAQPTDTDAALSLSR